MKKFFKSICNLFKKSNSRGQLPECPKFPPETFMRSANLSKTLELINIYEDPNDPMTYEDLPSYVKTFVGLMKIDYKNINFESSNLDVLPISNLSQEAYQEILKIVKKDLGIGTEIQIDNTGSVQTK